MECGDEAMKPHAAFCRCGEMTEGRKKLRFGGPCKPYVTPYPILSPFYKMHPLHLPMNRCLLALHLHFDSVNSQPASKSLGQSRSLLN